MYLFGFLIMLQALSVLFAFDVELEGIVRLGKDFFNTLATAQENYGLPDTKTPHLINLRSKDKLPKKFSRSVIMRANTVRNNRTDDLIEYVDHIKKKGEATLKHVAKQIMKGMKIEKDFKEQIKALTEDYITTIQDYLQYMIDQKAEVVIDEESTFLDMAETACRLLHREQKKLLNEAVVTSANFINKNNTTSNQTSVKRLPNPIQIMSETLYRQGIKTKREELRHICNKYEICRPYPAFSDYFADFIVEILRLSEDKLETLSKLIKLLAKHNEAFFDKICEKEDKETIIVPQISELLNDINAFQETLLVLRGILIQRFKIIDNPNLKLKMRTQAVRMLLDIINKAFQYENDELLAMEFDTVVKDVRSWNNGERHFPEWDITKLINNVINILDYNWNKNAKKEVHVLIETVLRGSAKDEEMYRSLFSEGSKFVRGDDITHGIEII